jgi:hypothetical protein
MGKHFIAYLPCEVAANTGLHAGLAWNTADGSGQTEFQNRYTRVVRFWADRLGSLLDGWWFDGCYTWPVFHQKYMDWPLWYAAARSGNSQAVLTWNDGSFCVGTTVPVRPEHDYLSGEVEMLVNGRIRLGRDLGVPCTLLPDSRFIPGTTCQWHALVPIDCFWGHGSPAPTWLPGNPYKEIPRGVKSAAMEAPLYSDEELLGFLNNCACADAAVTLNAGIYQEGHLGSQTVEQLVRVSTALSDLRH